MAKVHEVDTILQKTAMQQPRQAFVADTNVGCKIPLLTKTGTLDAYQQSTGYIVPLIDYVLFR